MVFCHYYDETLGSISSTVTPSPQPPKTQTNSCFYEGEGGVCHGARVEVGGDLGECVTSFFLLAFLELTLYVKGMHHYYCQPRESQESNRGGQAWQQGSTVKPSWPSALKPILRVMYAHL